LIKVVHLGRRAKSDLLLVPHYIRIQLLEWIEAVQLEGLERVRKIPGYHDQPLKGKRTGQRSIRLNRSYRAFYKILANNEIEFVEVIEVNKHEY
jgi:proteic killer suppression protein